MTPADTPPSDPNLALFDLQRQSFALLQQLVRDRAAGEAALVEEYRSATETAEREVQKARRVHAAARKKALDEIESEQQADEQDTEARFAAEFDAMERAYQESRAKAEQQYRIAEARLKNEHKERIWTVDSMLEAAEKENDQEKAVRLRQVKEAEEHIAAVWSAADAQLLPFGLTRESIAFRSDRLPPPTATDPVGKVERSLEDIDAAAEKLAGAALPKLVGLWGTVWCVFIAGGLSTLFGLAIGMKTQLLPIVGVVGAILGGLLLRQVLWILARRQVRDRGSALGVFLGEAERVTAFLARFTEKQHAEKRQVILARHQEQRRQVDELFLPKIHGYQTQGKNTLAKLENDRAAQWQKIEAARVRASRERRIHYAQRTKEITRTLDQQLEEAEARFSAKSSEAEAKRRTSLLQQSETWQRGLDEVRQAFATLIAAGERCFPAWAAFHDPEWALATQVPGGIRLGEYQVEQSALPGGLAKLPELQGPQAISARVPAFLPFPDRSAVLFKARDEGRDATVSALQSIMLRFLTALPPGKVRFTIVDPVGLGENFAAFMHLADYDEQLVSNRIWTEPSHIEKRLADLTEHMETVIQKYLRNQYKSIEDYNRAAGEVAEPYRVLVIANFPTNFTPEAARRLVSIMSSGPACGVCTLIGLDSIAPLPRDFRLADIEQPALTFLWRNHTFSTLDPVLAPFPLTIDPPPSSATIAAIVKTVGEASRTAQRVEVPFEYIAPSPDRIWTGSTRKGFDVPIGRAGATRRQIFSLGQGTAQHALVAGKTGSGKSTLLHALITNLALIYSPDEAELYLIDFKKGVEFKMYAALGLPHARVVAIESEREFGISVLQRLDAILRERGDRYRAAGVNDVAAYREACPGERFPRILLVVDEFQEFFVEDDKLAQEAGLLLDRLVRQGRAFGVHVLLGSQTLGGAYSIPRATIDQMAVRIALQCSDADAQLILSKDNTAARLLSRPGDAIYNDANGLVEGNDPFQVVWLSDDRREQVIQQLQQRAAGRTDLPLLVFEGSSAAELPKCKPLQAMAEAAGSHAPVVVWLGDAVAIKEPTNATFRPQSGANLLLLGQQEESALGLMTAALAALVARLRPEPNGTRRVAVLDGTPDDAETADYLRRVCTALDLPGLILERADLPAGLAEFSAELDRRQKGVSPDRSPRFLLVHGLQRFRELRKPEDDFGFGRRAEGPPAPGTQFANLLREGPALGLHVIVWCDSLTNLTRALDRQGLREFNLRVLFQMSANDSSQLIDSPAASRLGRTRALYVEEGLERPEKFRPYGFPGLDWLRRFADDLPADETVVPA